MGGVVVVVPSIHDILLAERVLLPRGVAFDVEPTPTAISSDCGMVMVVSERDLAKLQAALKQLAIEVLGLFTEGPEGWRVYGEAPAR